MNTALIFAAIGLFVLQTLSMKLQHAPLLHQKLLVNCAFCALSFAALGAGALCMPAAFRMQPITLLCGLAFGIVFSLTILFYNLAIAAGPLSYTTFYFSASMLIPTFAGLLFFGESFRWALAVAMALFFVAFSLLNLHPGQTEQKPNRRWPLYCLLAFVCNGLSAVVQKSQQTLCQGTEALGMMLAGFGFACISYGILYLVVRPREHCENSLSLIRQNTAAIALLALGSTGGNLLLTWLAGRVSASYLFPLVQGGIILGVTVCSVLFFREKLSLRGKIGLFAGICAIVLINF